MDELTQEKLATLESALESARIWLDVEKQGIILDSGRILPIRNETAIMEYEEKIKRYEALIAALKG